MGRHGWKGAPGRGNSIGQGQDLREGMLAQTQWIEGLGAQKMRPGCQQGAVTQGLDLEGSRLGLGQRKGRLSRRQYSGRNGAFGWSWEHGRRREGGGREDGDNELSFVLPSAGGGVTTKISSCADLLNFPGRKEHLPAAPPAPNIPGRKERDLFCQRSLQIKSLIQGGKQLLDY